MKRIEVLRFTESNLWPSVEQGFFDNRKNKRAWKYLALNWFYWKLRFNYGLVDYSAYKD